MTGHGSKFGRKKEAAIIALLTHRNLEEAARAVNVAPKTLVRWQKEPEFQAAFREATPPSTKVRAADSILNHTAKAIELEDVEARVAALEQATEASRKRWR